MAWLAFTKKSQTRNIALLEFKHLLAQLQKISDISNTLWSDPYAVGFFMGYTMGVGIHVAGKAARPADVSKAFYEVLMELVPDKAVSVAKQFSHWDQTGNPAFNEGQSNGTIFALFSYNAARLDNEPLILQAQLKADAMAPLWDALNQNPSEHSRVMSALREIVFYDRVCQLK
jgi:hypothetical protein